VSSLIPSMLNKISSDRDFQRLQLKKQDLERSLEEQDDRVDMAFDRMKKPKLMPMSARSSWTRFGWRIQNWTIECKLDSLCKVRYN
jgi:hypothetical protein